MSCKYKTHFFRESFNTKITVPTKSFSFCRALLIIVLLLTSLYFRFSNNFILKSTSLNIGSEIFKRSVSDSSSAVVYNQFPKGNDDNTLNIGSVIDLFYSNNKIKDL